MNANPRRPLRLATTVGLLLIVILLVGNALVSEWNIDRLVENEHGVVHTQMVLTMLEEVLARVTEAETGERGYLITGDEDYLRSYRTAIGRTEETLQRLAKLAAGDAQQQRRINALRERVQLRFDELRNAIAAEQAGGFDAAKHSVSTNQGRRLMNEMRRLVGEMQQREQQALALRSDESRRSAITTMVTDVVGCVIGVGLVGLAMFLFQSELSHRQRADNAVRRLAAIVESSDDAIISKSLDGQIVSWNAGARRIYGYTAEEVIGRPVALLCPPERVDEVLYNLDRVKHGSHIEHFETNRIRKDGRRIDVSLSISPIRDGAGAVIGASAIARDVTERKELQREVLEIAAREQQRIGQDLHDGTGQELTGLAMMAERLTGELAGRSLPQAAASARIVDGLEQALRHVRALSKGLVPVEVDAEGLMVALADLAARTSELHGIDCTFRCKAPVCILDNQTATHLYRLSQESVTNSLKHGRARKIVISLADDGELITLKIADDGKGFSEELHHAPGTGLRIMRYRAGLIRAKLTIGPAVPRGTQVTCTLPRQQDSWHANEPASERVSPPEPEAGNLEPHGEQSKFASTGHSVADANAPRQP